MSSASSGEFGVSRCLRRAVKLQTTSRNRLGKPGVLTTMARLSQWALENGYLDSERGKDSSEPSGDQPEEPGAAPSPRSNKE